MEYRFRDPLTASDGAARRRIRRAHALIYGAAAPSLALAAFADGGPLGQRLTCVVAAALTALFAGLMLAWRRAPDGVLLAGFPLASLTVTAIAVLDPPLSLTPMYYVWPLLCAAYFLQRRELALNYVVVCVGFGAASFPAIQDGTRLMQWATVAIVGAVVITFVATLTERLQALVGRLNVLAREDSLTGALNRRAFLERVDAELARASRAGAPCAIALVDVDHFKTINDERGHAAGDAALRGLVATVTSRLRRGDALGRLGGDEFAVLLAGADASDCEAYASSLRELIAADARAAGIPLTASVGVASRPADSGSAEALLAAADDALYRAKRAGRDTVRSV